MAGRSAVNLLWDDFVATFLSRIPDGGTLIDVGAGPGLMAIRILENRPSLKIIVTDFSPRMLELARANLARASLDSNGITRRKDQVEFVQVNAVDLSQFANRKIDGVYSTGAIKHFLDPVKCLHQAENILTGGGIMYFKDFCADGTYSGAKEIVAKLNLSPFMRRLMHPIIHFGKKKEAPSASEVRSWVKEFHCGGGLEVAFSSGSSMFTLVYQKCGGSSANEKRT